MLLRHAVEAERADERTEIQDFELRQLKWRTQRLSLQQPNRTAACLPFDGNTTSPFFDENWTLEETARWAIARTVEAVNGFSIDRRNLFEILPEIHSTLHAGEISAFATTSNDPIPRELPPETWSIYALVVEEEDGLARIVVLNPSCSCGQELLNVRVKREDVLGRWPAHSSTPIPIGSTTVVAENRCRRWLAAMMKANREQPKRKAAVREEALAKFQGLSGRGFGRAWDEAIDKAVAPKWRAPGRRRS